MRLNHRKRCSLFRQLKMAVHMKPYLMVVLDKFNSREINRSTILTVSRNSIVHRPITCVTYEGRICPSKCKGLNMWIIAKRRFLFVNPETEEQHTVTASGEAEEAPDWIKQDELYNLARKERSLMLTEEPPAPEEDDKEDKRVRHVKQTSGLPTWKK
jgi:hypothetical protein